MPAQSDPPRAIVDWLPRLAEVLVADHEPAGPTGAEPAVIVGIELTPAGCALGVRPLDPGVHPAAVLPGFVAPDEWAAFGVVAGGWATRDVAADDRARNRMRTRPSASPVRVRVRTVFLAARTGEEASAVLLPGEPAIVHSAARAADPAAIAGLVPDLVRRSMGLPTAPPAFPPGELLAATWLSDAAAALAAGDCLPPAPDVDPATTWADLRWHAVEHGPRYRVDASMAAWLDDGSFARYAVTAFPPVDDLLAEVLGRAGADQAARIRATLAWVLPSGEWDHAGRG